MSDKLQNAFDSWQRRQDENKKVIQKKDNKINAAFEAREKRIISDLGGIVSDLQKQINAEIRAYESIQPLTFGLDTLKTALKSTNKSRVNIPKIKNKVTA